MKMLRILLLVLWCSVLVLPVQAKGVVFATPFPATQQLSDQQTDMALVFATVTMPGEDKALLQLDKELLLPALHQPGHLYFGTVVAIKVPSAFPVPIRANGLHTILTAGP